MLVQRLDPVLGSDCYDARTKAKALMAEAGIADDDSDTFWVGKDDTQNNATDCIFFTIIAQIRKILVQQLEELYVFPRV
jgi:hypothetical protein